MEHVFIFNAISQTAAKSYRTFEAFFFIWHFVTEFKKHTCVVGSGFWRRSSVLLVITPINRYYFVQGHCRSPSFVDQAAGLNILLSRVHVSMSLYVFLHKLRCHITLISRCSYLIQRLRCVVCVVALHDSA